MTLRSILSMEQFLLEHIAAGRLCLASQGPIKHHFVELHYTGADPRGFASLLKTHFETYLENHHDTQVEIATTTPLSVTIRNNNKLSTKLIRELKRARMA